MNCRDANELLWELCDGLLAEEQSAKLRDHLQTCSACKEEWASLRQFADWFDTLSPALSTHADWPPESPPHLTTEELLALAEYSGDDLDEEKRSRWKHMLDCRSCYEACWRLRGVFRHTDSEAPEIDLPFQTILKARQEASMVIALEWVGAALELRSRAKALRQRTRGRDDLSNNVWSIQAQVNEYVITVTISSEAPGNRTCKIDLSIAALDDEPVLEDIRANIYRLGKGLFGSQPFRGAQTSFRSLPVADYHIEVVRDDDIIASIEIPITSR